MQTTMMMMKCKCVWCMNKMRRLSAFISLVLLEIVDIRAAIEFDS